MIILKSPVCVRAAVAKYFLVVTVATLSLLCTEAVQAQNYSIGDPTDEEQLFLEFINRARANPQAEAQLLKNSTNPDILASYYETVDLNLMVSQFAALAAKPPLAFEPRLIAAARAHANDMRTNNFQGHTGSNGSTIGARYTAAGYTGATFVGENAYSSSRSVLHGHAAFEVDWGPGTGGMQTPPPHRNLIHSTVLKFREIGIGVVNGTSASFGPQFVVQDFAWKNGSLPMITGVAYYDINGDGAYSIGEGIGGVTVTSPSTTYQATTSNSGGYALPVSANGSYSVTFAGGGFPATTRTVTVANLDNVKLDFVPAYAGPAVSGPAQTPLNVPSSYSFTALNGATGYRWRSIRNTPFILVEGAENGLTNVTPFIDTGYSVIADAPYVSHGAHSFHLTHTDPAVQYLQLTKPLRVTSQSVLTFSSRLTTAATTQAGKVEVLVAGDTSWQTLNWEERGNCNPSLGLVCNSGAATFTAKSLPLSQFAGKEILVRFRYEITPPYLPGGGIGFVTGGGAGIGWYIDQIQVTNSEQLSGEVITPIASGTTFSFQPSAAGSYLLQVQAQVGGRWLPWGRFFATSSAAPPGPPTGLRITP